MFDPAAMDALLLLAPSATSIGYDGRGDFLMAPDGRLERRGERQVAPFVYAGAAILAPALFAGVPAGPLSLNHCSTARSRPGASTASGWRACGCMSARREAIPRGRGGDRRQHSGIGASV